MAFKIVELAQNAVLLAQTELSAASAAPSENNVKWRTDILDAAKKALSVAVVMYSYQRDYFLYMPAPGGCYDGNMGATVAATQQLRNIFSGPFVDRTYHYAWIMACKYVALYGGSVP